ncbi:MULTISPECIES: HlyD family secretion protein [unclassified Serratia (in: enterobacteria)]|uniref:HlyD family secretion protein n=1 Tax=unclassified Serratia (in: enterobacteria) TaxID=2647522 RepID=UPI003075EFEC
MKNDLFREQALKNRNDLWSSKSFLPQGIPVWIVASAVIFILSIIILYLIFGGYNRRVLVSGEVISEPRAVSIFAAQQGYISGQFVHAGDHVTKGQSLYQLDTSKKTSSGILNATQKNNILKKMAVINEIIRQTENNKVVTLASLQKQIDNVSALLKKIRGAIGGAEHGLIFMEKNMQNYNTYLSRGLINKEQLINQMSIFYQRQNDMLNLKNQDSQFELQLINLQTNLKTQETDFNNRINELLIQKSEAQRQLADTDADGVILVSAPLSGHVESISVTPGEMVSPGASLLQILPGKVSRYILVMWVPGHAAPYVSPGDKVNIRYDAFPAEKFGQFPGHVVSISAVPASVQEMSTYPSTPTQAPGSAEVWYKLLVKPDTDGFEYRGKKFSFSNGMKASCVLFLENRKLYQWIFSPLYDIRNSTEGPLNAPE